MSRRRKPTAESVYIWEQLEQISQAYYAALRQREDPAEAYAAWQRLWQEIAADGKLERISIDDAGHFLWWGWILAMADRRYDAATELMSAYFQHPEIELDDELTRILYRCELARGILSSGDEAAAVEILRPLLGCERKSRVRWALVHMTGDLTDYLSEPAGDKQALRALAELVEEIVNRLRRRVPRKKRLPENATYGDLLRLLDSTYTPSGQAALRAERESRNGARVGVTKDPPHPAAVKTESG